MFSSPHNLAIFHLVAFVVSLQTANGYILGRIIDFQDMGYPEISLDGGDVAVVDDPQEQRIQQLFVPSSSPPDLGSTEIMVTPGITKKSSSSDFPRSVQPRKELIRKLGSSSSRNCFFTPIQCMIQHDTNKYRKLVENNISIGNINRRGFKRTLPSFMQQRTQK